MSALVIYDNLGVIYMSTSGTYVVPQGGVQFLEVEIPDDKIIKSIDVSVIPNVPVYEDIPKTGIELANEKITDLETENASINYALMIGGLV